MKGPFDAPLAWGLSAALHIAVYGYWAAGAPQAAGEGGAASATVPGMSGVVEATIVVWEPPLSDTPPAAVVEMAAMAVPPPPDAAAAPAPEALAPRAVAAEAPAPPRQETPPPEAPPAPVAAPAPEIAAPPELAAMTPDATAPVAPPPPRDAGRAPAAPRPALAPPRAAEESGLPQAAPPPPPPAATADVPPVPRIRPEPRPAARPDLVAEGEGGAGLRGDAGRAEAPGLSDGARRSILAAWGAEIRARIEAGKVHPEGLRASGRPVVRITVARSGALEDVRVVRSSQVAALDAAALSAVRRAGAFPAAPRGLDLARASFDLPIAFTR